MDWTKYGSITKICSVCATMIKAISLAMPFDIQAVESGLIQPIQFDHLPDYNALSSSSHNCQLCNMFFYFLDQRLKETIWRLERDGGRQGYAPSEEKFEIPAKAAHNGYGNSVQLFPTLKYKGTNFSASDMDMYVWVRPRGSINDCKDSIWLDASKGDFASRLPLVKGWLSACVDTHSNCPNSMDQTLPTRVLWLTNPALPHSQVQLVNTNGSKGRYVALSYCWGAAVPFTTTKVTLPERLKGITISDLPRTMRDAVHAARQLDIDYLWIDSLAIIQDDKDDWAEEAAKMGSFYQNAIITFVAETGTDSDSGLFDDFVPSFIGHTDDLEFAFRIKKAHSPWTRPKVLYNRGWTMQESCLPSRLLVFGAKVMRWACATGVFLEDGSLPTTAYPLEFIGPIKYGTKDLTNSKDEIYERWATWIREYAKRQFTYFSDRLPALAGLTQYFSEILKDEPFLGLWKSQIVSYLLWYPLLLDTGKPTSIKSFPSWTWLSWSGHIEYGVHRNIHPQAPGFQSSSDLFDMATVLDASISWSATPLVSTPSATLVLQCRAVEILFSALTYFSPAKNGVGILGWKQPPATGPGDGFFIVHDIDENYSGHVTLLEAASCHHQDWRTKQQLTYYRILMLIEDGSIAGAYRRIGCGLLTRRNGHSDDLFYGAKTKTVSLV
jgi:hypothetical protein